MFKFVFLRRVLAAASTLFAIATLTPPGVTIPTPSLASVRAFERLCSLYWDPHDKFTRVMPGSDSASLRSNITLSNISVNYVGFPAEGRLAFQAAVDLWATQLNSPVPIVVDAQFLDLNSPLLLGHGGFRSLSVNFPGAPLVDVLYPGPIANRLSGVDRNGGVTELVVLINSTPNWNFAIDGVPVAGKIDFMTVVMHELAHGFGHFGSANVSTSTGQGSWGITARPYVYDTFVVDSASNSILNGSKYPNPSGTLAALLQGQGVAGPGLFWIGPNGTAGNGGVRPKLYTPPVFSLASSYSHLDDATYPAGSLNSLMTPSLGSSEVIHTSGSILNGMLADMGWGSQCSFALSPNPTSIGVAGGTLTTTVSTSTNCPWTAMSTSPFVTVTGGASGNASALITLSVAPNFATTPRVGTVQVADQILSITQAGTTPCAYSIDPTNVSVGAGGGIVSTTITTLTGCPWVALSRAAYAAVTFPATASGFASGPISISIPPNTDPESRLARIEIADQVLMIAQPGTAPCSFGLSPEIVPIGVGGGSVSTTVTTTPGCVWSASTASPFATITAPTPPSGNTSGTVSVLVAASSDPGPRLALVQIADKTLTISQSGTAPCTFTLTPTSATAAGTGGSGTVALDTLPACAWTATANPAEAQFTSAAGVGPATIAYTVAPNPTCSERAVTLTIGGQSFVITQGAAPPFMSIDAPPLKFGAVLTRGAFTSKTGAQTARLIQNGTGSVTWTAVSSAPWLSVSPASGSGGATLLIAVQEAAGLTPTQTATVTITYSGSSNSAGTIAATLDVLPAQPTAPFGSFDTPTDGASGLAGSVAVTGWALDDIEVTRVRIMRDAVAGESAGALVYVGDANLVEGARPDVQAQFLGVPRSSRAGWGYLMLTNFLPNLGNGMFRLTAIAEDADGHTTVLGSKTITVANATATAPFGAIDTPTQGGTITGTLVNFGWVAVAAPRRADPPGGGDVRIVIDGAFLPTRPDGWTSRIDLSRLFPLDLYPGILTALAVAELDTTTLTNGVHTIAWVVSDDLGVAEGVGSRYFTVANPTPPTTGSCLPPAITTDPSVVSSLRSALQGRRGYATDAPLRSFEPDADGRFTIQSEEVDRVELRLARGDAGFLRVAGQLLPLPAGSRIDPATGVFTWQPGVGFLGAYDFVLGGREVRIVLNPKGSNRSGPQLVIDTPQPGYDAADSFIVAGWAADLDAAIDGGVDTVHVWAYPSAGGAPIFIGAAAFGGERPDVAAIYGERFGKSGYGIEVGGLAPGAYDIAVFAYSTVSGGFAPAKTVRVTVR